MQETEFWVGIDIAGLEEMRLRLRELVPLLDKTKRHIVFTDFEDEITGVHEGGIIDIPRMTGLEYQRKVEQYLQSHLNNIVILAAGRMANAVAVVVWGAVMRYTSRWRPQRRVAYTTPAKPRSGGRVRRVSSQSSLIESTRSGVESSIRGERGAGSERPGPATHSVKTRQPVQRPGAVVTADFHASK